jgi:hypothetical protein
VVKRIVGVLLVVFGLLGIFGVVDGKERAVARFWLLVVFAIPVAGGAAVFRSASRHDKRLAVVSEQQKLIALGAESGTLTATRVVVALGWTKEEADAALTRLRASGLAEFDVDEAGAPVYRLSKDALAARREKDR